MTEKSVIERMFFLIDFCASANFKADLVIETSLYSDIEKDMSDYLTHTNAPFYGAAFFNKMGVKKEDMKPYLIFAKGRRIFIIFQSTNERVFDATPEIMERFKK